MRSRRPSATALDEPKKCDAPSRSERSSATRARTDDVGFALEHVAELPRARTRSVRTSQRLAGVSQREAPSSHPQVERDSQLGYARRRPEESVLYGVVQSELATFLARAHARERPVPRFVERELRGFLACGILAHGFVRVHCDACGLDRVVAFSCKGRGFCPSCGGRRMADTAAHLVDRTCSPRSRPPVGALAALGAPLPPGLRRPAHGRRARRSSCATVFASLRRRARSSGASRAPSAAPSPSCSASATH
jgi:hypothetical protein